MSTLYVRVGPPAGGDVNVSLQRINPDGSDGDFWDATTESWGAITFHDTTELPTATSGYVYSGAYAFDDAFSGNIILGTHDGNASNVVLSSQIVTMVSGRDATVVVAQNRVNRPLDKDMVVRLSRRHDGLVGTNRELNVAPGDDVDFAIDTSPLFAEGVVVQNVVVNSVAPSGELVVSALGPQSQLAMLSLDGGQVVNGTYVATVQITMDTGEVVRPTVTIKCKAV